MGLFLDDDAQAELTGWKSSKKQIEWLKSQGLPFYVNARGKPKVPVVAITGETKAVQKPAQEWQPHGA